MNEKASLVVVDLAKDFISLLNDSDQKWMKGYFRFLFDIDYYQSSSSYSTSFNVFIIDSMKHSDICYRMDQKAEQLFDAIERSKGVMLLVVDCDFNYDIKFEWNDLGRWRITKLDGGTGLPLGL